MQTIEFLRTARWILSQYSEPVREFLLQGTSALRGEKDQRPQIALLKITHELSRVRPVLAAHAHAPQVLKAFGLEVLLEENFPIQVASIVVRDPEQAAERRVEPMESINEHWSIFTNCIGPVEGLVTPTDVLAERDFDEVLTVEMRHDGEKLVALDAVAEAIDHLRQLYSSITRAISETEDPLSLLYADSGSSLRLDLRGNGKSIKGLKELLVEAWNKIRHRKADDLTANNKAIFSSLSILREIESRRQQRSIGDEDAANLGKKIVQSTLGLFETGALPREIPTIESVHNLKLVEAMQPKLLTGPSDSAQPPSTPQHSPRRRKPMKPTTPQP